jgi:hypothetical protein
MDDFSDVKKLEKYIAQLSVELRDSKRLNKKDSYEIKLLEQSLDLAMKKLKKYEDSKTGGSIISMLTQVLLESEKALFTEEEWKLEQDKIYNRHKSKYGNI